MHSELPRRSRWIGTFLVLALLGMSGAGGASAQEAPPPVPEEPPLPTVMMVVDTSGSMAGSRLAQAKEALTASVGALAPDQQAGLRSYSGSCGDQGTLREPLGADNRDELRADIDSLSAFGGTPTPDALLGAAGDLGGVSGPE